MTEKRSDMDSSKEIFDYFKKFNLENYIEEERAQEFQLKKYEKNSFVMMSGTLQKKIYLFVEGYVKITLFSKSGDEMLLELVSPFDIFGDVEFIMGTEINYNVQVIEPSIFLEIESAKIEKDIQIYKLISKTLALKLYNTSEKYSNNKLYDSKSRVLNFIKDNEAYVSNSVKFGEMAKLLGLSERQLRRVLSNLQSENLIKKTGKKIVYIKKDL